MFHHSPKRKQIILVRHAKAIERTEWKGSDFDRPLSVVGDSANKIVANYIRLIGIKPDRIISSSSVRTRSTTLGITEKLSIKAVEYMDTLYNEPISSDRDINGIYMSAVRKAKKSDSILMIVGHNPDMSVFARYLSGDDVPSMKK
jgi:phosphohistidine phosphatase